MLLKLENPWYHFCELYGEFTGHTGALLTLDRDFNAVSWEALTETIPAMFKTICTLIENSLVMSVVA